jgi:hypothetical protein
VQTEGELQNSTFSAASQKGVLPYQSSCLTRTRREHEAEKLGALPIG